MSELKPQSEPRERTQSYDMKNKLFVMRAASGAGKTTLKDLVIKDFPDIKYSISATTRAPREGEVDGVHYFFKTKEEFEKLIKEDGLIEWNEVHGNYYGTPKSFVEKTLAEGNRVLFDLDVFGKVNFDKVYPDATGILILPPSEEELEKRLRRSHPAPSQEREEGNGIRQDERQVRIHHHQRQFAASRRRTPLDPEEGLGRPRLTPEPSRTGNGAVQQ